jgi:hypothetical protein
MSLAVQRCGEVKTKRQFEPVNHIFLLKRRVYDFASPRIAQIFINTDTSIDHLIRENLRNP